MYRRPGKGSRHVQAAGQGIQTCTGGKGQVAMNLLCDHDGLAATKLAKTDTIKQQHIRCPMHLQ